MTHTLQYYAHNADKETLRTASHYKYELQLLEGLQNECNFDLRVGTRPGEISTNADLYFSRWGTTGALPVLMSKGARAPSIVYTGGSEVAHKSDSEFGNFYLDRPLWQRLVIQFTLRFSTQTIVTSEYLASDVETISGCKPSVLPHFIDTERFSPGPIDSLPVSYREGEYMITISWLSESHIRIKRLCFLLEMIAESDSKLNLVLVGGDRGGYEILKEKVEELSISDRVYFVFDPPIAEKIDLLRGARIAVQPTLHEGFGMAILEALSCGTPLVTSPNGSVPEVCGNAAAYASATDLQEFRTTVESLWSDEKRLADYAERARDRATDNFSLVKGRDRYREIITEHLP